jgi:signal transduction histidine kinase
VVPVAVPILLGLVLALLLVVDQDQRSRLRVDAEVRSAVAAGLPAITEGFRTQLAQASATAAATGIAVPASSATGSALDVLIEARDGGVAVLDDVAVPAQVVVPVYRAGAPVATTAQRRQAISGYRTVPLSLLQVLTDVAPTDGGAAVLGPSGRVVATTDGMPHGARKFAVPLDLTGNPGWVLEAWLPDAGVATGTWLWAAALLLVAGLAAGYLTVRQRQTTVEARRQATLERDTALVTGLAPVVQAGLDLAQVLPAACTHLADGLGLLGLSLSVPSGTIERPLFNWGRTPDAGVQPVSPAGRRLHHGETFAVSLTRGGRVLGVLRVVAGDELSRHDLLALTTASELLGSSLANAETFARQQALMERLRSVDELKTVFLATASHELRTPVTAIVGFSSLMLADWEKMNSEQGRSFLERVVANARSLETLIEQLLDFSRLERGMQPASDELLDVGTTTLRILTDQPELYGVHELRTQVMDGCVVRGSSTALERIVSNLVGNAAKYSPSGTTITVAVRADGEHVLLTVDDEGPGVPEADRERVFSRFYRGPGDAVAKTRGAGIGLAIVAEFAASMSATAEVTQAPSGGARFCITFPIALGLDSAAAEGGHLVPLS